MMFLKQNKIVENQKFERENKKQKTSVNSKPNYSYICISGVREIKGFSWKVKQYRTICLFTDTQLCFTDLTAKIERMYFASACWLRSFSYVSEILHRRPILRKTIIDS